MAKHKLLIRCFSVCFCFLLFSLIVVPVFANAETDSSLPSMAEANAVLLYHIERNTVVCSKNEATHVGAGSTVKIMAGLLFCETLADRQSETVMITEELLQAVPTSSGYALKIEEGDRLTVRQLLFAAICGGYNDAFYLLSAYTDGSTEAFLQRMNERAQMLGAMQTGYTDLTGISTGSYTTASDLVRIALEAYQNALYMELCNTDAFYISSEKISKMIYNRNALISTQGGAVTKYYNAYCNGMSAGSTSTDGNCVVTVAKHGNETYLCIVLGGQELSGTEYGYKITNRLIDWVYATYAYMEVISPNTEICNLPITVSDMTTELAVRTAESYSAYLPRGAEVGKDVTFSIRLTSTSLEAPVAEGTFVGYVAIVYNGQILKTLSLYTVGSAERSTIISSLKVIQSWTERRAVRAGAVFFVLSVSAWLIIEYVLSRRRHHRWDKYFSNKVEMQDTFLHSRQKNVRPQSKTKR